MEGNIMTNSTNSTNPGYFHTSYETFQFYCLWNLPTTLSERLDTYQLIRVPAQSLRESLGLESVSAQGDKLFYLHDTGLYPVSWHSASPYQLLRDSQSNKRGKTKIFYWVSLRALGPSKLAVISVDLSTIPS